MRGERVAEGMTGHAFAYPRPEDGFVIRAIPHFHADANVPTDPFSGPCSAPTRERQTATAIPYSPQGLFGGKHPAAALRPGRVRGRADASPARGGHVPVVPP